MPDPIEITPQDRDIAVRTMLGEASSQGDDGLLGIVNVLLNRASTGKFGGTSVSGVALAPSQFEPWSTRRQELLSISPDSPAYQRAGQIFDAAAAGKAPDNTGGATNFYSPSSQAALGRAAPAWATSPTATIGGHSFYAPSGRVASAPQQQDQQVDGGDLLKLYTKPSAPSAAAPASSSQQAPAAPASDDNTPGVSFATPAQTDLLSMYTKPMPSQQTSAQAPQAAPATPIDANGAVRAVATGVPIIGGALNKADAAVDAALAPLMNPLFAPKDQLKGSTFGERYAAALAQQEGMDRSFAEQHPVANTALNVAGAVGASIPAMAAAPAAFGATEAGVVPNMLLGALGGGGIGAADAAVRSNGDPAATKSGAALGAVFGAAGPGLGAAATAGVNRLANALTGTNPAARNVAGILSEIGMTPQAAQDALTRIGPSATLADVDPALTTEAGGLASLGGRPTSVLKNAMATRAAGADNRVATAIDSALGSKPDLEASLDAMLERGRQAAAPYYAAARANADPVDVQPLLSEIDQRIAGSTGGVADTLRTLRGYLVRDFPGFGTVPKSDPEQLLGARQAMDDLIERRGTADTTAGRNAIRQAQDVRSRLDAVLKQDGNIASGDAAYAGQMQLRDAMQEGTQLFTRGVRPEEFTRQLAQMSPEEVQAYRAGARVAIGDALEQARQGTLAGARSMFGRSSANRAKLDALFPNAGGVFDMLEGEAAMRSTEQRVAQNSATAERRAVQEKYAPSQGDPMSAAPAVVGEALGGGAGAVGMMAARTGYRALANALTNGARNRLVDGTANALAATGPAQDAFMQQLARASRTNVGVNALANGAGAATNLLLRSAPNPLLRLYAQPQS